MADLLILMFPMKVALSKTMMFCLFRLHKVEILAFVP